MDRASGSGVFGRDPDALLDYIELELNDDILKQEENKAVCAVCEAWLEKHIKTWEEEVSQDDRCSEKVILGASERLLGPDLYRNMLTDVYAARVRIQQRTAWRIEGTLREFPKFRPVNLWFDYPVHYLEDNDILKDVEAEGEKPPWKKAMEKRKPKEKREKEYKIATENAYESCLINDNVTLKDMAEYLSLTEKTVRNRLTQLGNYEIKNGVVKRKST
jgi:hypothetical protein